MKECDVFEYIENLNKEYPDQLDYYTALADFMVDYDFLKDTKQITQNEIAEKMGTSQSAVSRLEAMKTNPTYKQLEKLSKAVDGRLLITPMGDMTVTVPYDLQEKVRKIAEELDTSTISYLKTILRDAIEDKYASLENFRV